MFHASSTITRRCLLHFGAYWSPPVLLRKGYLAPSASRIPFRSRRATSSPDAAHESGHPVGHPDKAVSGVEAPVGTLRQRAIEPMGCAEWAEMGLIQIKAESAVAKMKLFPFQEMVIAYDVPRRLLTGEGGDYVMGAGGSSLTLANLTIRRHAGLSLDLGTGCGFQAFLQVRHSDRVVAVDRNPRAVAIAAFNARLNGLANVECRERRSIRSGGRNDLRHDRLQSSLCDLAGIALHLPRQRHGGRRRIPVSGSSGRLRAF